MATAGRLNLEALLVARARKVYAAARSANNPLEIEHGTKREFEEIEEQEEGVESKRDSNGYSSTTNLAAHMRLRELSRDITSGVTDVSDIKLKVAGNKRWLRIGLALLLLL